MTATKSGEVKGDSHQIWGGQEVKGAKVKVQR